MTLVPPRGLTILPPHDESSQCLWSFAGYVASADELRWRAEVLVPSSPSRIEVCNAFVTSPFNATRDRYASELPKCVHGATDTSAKLPLTCEEVAMAPRKFNDAFSLMKYKRTCNGVTEEESVAVAIEPLVGPLRHPLVCDDFWKHVFDKNYMVVEPWRAHANWDAHATTLGLPPRNFFFDLGASTFTAGSGGASQSWFVRMFEDMCVMWDGIFAWEATQHESAKVWADVPGYLHGRYHWYNVPCSKELDSWANPWNTLLSVATPEDYVVVKLDIDTWQVENPLVDQILATPALLERIDEFFYEHHVQMQPMFKYWGPSANKKLTGADSVDMFTRLRKAGIHAHSWV
jgi:hypothetical protein